MRLLWTVERTEGETVMLPRLFLRRQNRACTGRSCAEVGEETMTGHSRLCDVNVDLQSIPKQLQHFVVLASQP